MFVCVQKYERETNNIFPRNCTSQIDIHIRTLVFVIMQLLCSRGNQSDSPRRIKAEIHPSCKLILGDYVTTACTVNVI